MEAEAPALRERKSLAEDAPDARRDLILIKELTAGEPIRERDTAVVNIGRAFSARDAEIRKLKQ